MHKPGNQSSDTKITAAYKVKKNLFDSRSKFKSPISHSSEYLSDHENQSYSPDIMNTLDESPYSLFSNGQQATGKKFRLNSITSNMVDYNTPLKSSQSLIEEKDDTTPNNPVKLAVLKSIQDPELIGDFSKKVTLPIIEGTQTDLKTVSPDTVFKLLQQNTLSFTVIDCRYPYEFAAGHIKTSRNLYCKSVAEEEFFSNKDHVNRNIFIFYCEFSSERAPSMIRYIRSRDRDLNRDKYPRLNYPELYLMEGGYRDFYFHFKVLCEPQGYVPMADKNFFDEFNHYRNKCRRKLGKRWKKN